MNFNPLKNVYFIITLLVIILIIGIFIFIRQRQETYETVTAQRQNLSSTVIATGFLSSKFRSDLSFKVSGKINWVGVEVGDKVKVGQSLVSIDNRDLEITLSEKLANLRAAQASAEKAEDDVKDHDEDETFAQKETRTKAQAARDAAWELKEAARENLKNATLFGPISGTITAVNIEVGESVTANTTKVITIADLTKPIFVAEIDEADVNKVQIGMRTEVILEADEKQKYTGEVSKIYPRASTTSTGAKVFQIKITFKNFKTPFKLDMSGDVTIFTKTLKNIIAIPQESILETDEDNFVFVYKDGKVNKTKIATGIESDTQIEVNQGLKEGEIIIRSNIDKLENGQKIKISK